MRLIMNNDILRIVAGLLWMAIVIRIVMNVIHRFGPDFVGFFEDLRRKTDKIRDKN